MAFKDGLHNRVDIYPKQMQNDGREEKDRMKYPVQPAKENVHCRIIRDEKALFLPEVNLESGDRLIDKKTGVSYQVMHVRKVYGKEALHHLSCGIKLWGLKQEERSERNGQNPYSNR